MCASVKHRMGFASVQTLGCCSCHNTFSSGMYSTWSEQLVAPRLGNQTMDAPHRPLCPRLDSSSRDLANSSRATTVPVSIKHRACPDYTLPHAYVLLDSSAQYTCRTSRELLQYIPLYVHMYRLQFPRTTRVYTDVCSEDEYVFPVDWNSYVGRPVSGIRRTSDSIHGRVQVLQTTTALLCCCTYRTARAGISLKLSNSVLTSALTGKMLSPSRQCVTKVRTTFFHGHSTSSNTLNVAKSG